MTKEEAVKLYDSKFWEGMSYNDKATFQLFEKRLCMPFDIFQEAVEKTLGRPVCTHEFTEPKLLQKELLGDRPEPSFEEIMKLIPQDKQLIIVGV